MTASSPAHDLDDRDLRILGILQRDGRIPMARLARIVHLSPTPCQARVRRLERLGYIKGYAAQLDPDRLDAAILIFVEVTLDRTSSDVFSHFARAIAEVAEVLEAHMVAGGFDYLIKLRCASMAGYRALLADKLLAIPCIAQTHTYVVMEQVKETSALPIPGLASSQLPDETA